jgi:hypothetical protein
VLAGCVIGEAAGVIRWRKQNAPRGPHTLAAHEDAGLSPCGGRRIGRAPDVGRWRNADSGKWFDRVLAVRKFRNRTDPGVVSLAYTQGQSGSESLGT